MSDNCVSMWDILLEDIENDGEYAEYLLDNDEFPNEFTGREHYLTLVLEYVTTLDEELHGRIADCLYDKVYLTKNVEFAKYLNEKGFMGKDERDRIFEWGNPSFNLYAINNCGYLNETQLVWVMKYLLDNPNHDLVLDLFNNQYIDEETFDLILEYKNKYTDAYRLGLTLCDTYCAPNELNE